MPGCDCQEEAVWVEGRIGRVELTPEEAERYYLEEKYIVTYGCIYQLFYSTARKRVYGQVIYRSKGMTRRGRFFAMDAEAVNRLVGFNLVNSSKTAPTGGGFLPEKEKL